MHKEFGDWYRTASLEPTGQTLDTRWKAIESFVGKAKVKDLLDIVRIFLGLPVRDHGIREKFVDGFRKTDTAFPSTGNEIELRVLAGAACIAGFETSEQNWEITETVAVAITSGGFRRRRKNLILPRLFDISEETLVERSAERFADAQGASDLVAAAAELKKVCTGANVGQHMEKPMAAFLDRLQEKMHAAETRQKLLQEETNVLWWLFGGYSRELDASFDEIDSQALPLVAGAELARLVEVQPGPVAFPGLLGRVLNGSTKAAKLTPGDSINALPRGWRERLRTETPEIILDLCPIRSAAVRSLDVADTKSWVKPAEGALGIAFGKPMEPLELALQSFRESMLVEYIDLK